MSTGSSIEWTNATWNPLVGCTPVSPGCLNCYAAGMARRHRKNPSQPDYHDGTVTVGVDVAADAGGGSSTTTVSLPVVETRNGRAVFTGEVRELLDKLELPFSWRKPRLVFANSMSDLFHEKVTREFQARVFAVMGLASWHTFQVLTKRAEIMAEVLSDPAFADLVEEMAAEYSAYAYEVAKSYGLFDPGYRVSTDWAAQDHVRLPMRNVWLGASCEDQPRADDRIPKLIKTPAAVRFLSCEPLLGPIDLKLGNRADMRCRAGYLSWVIVGGESGSKSRACNVSWVWDIVDQCRAAQVPVFVKQLGAVPIKPDPGARSEFDRGACVRMHLKDSKGGDMSEWPGNLRVREWPTQEVHA